MRCSDKLIYVKHWVF